MVSFSGYSAHSSGPLTRAPLPPARRASDTLAFQSSRHELKKAAPSATGSDPDGAVGPAGVIVLAFPVKAPSPSRIAPCA